MHPKQSTQKFHIVLIVAGIALLFAVAVFVPLSSTASAPSVQKTSAPQVQSAISPGTRERMMTAFGRMPLAFEANHGQSDAQVKYIARGSGYTLFLTSQDAVISLPAKTRTYPGSGGTSSTASSSVVRMHVIGTQSPARIAPQEPLPGVSNYLIGRDTRNWHSNVPHFARVHYSDVYPGIDLAYHGRQGQLEFDFVVSPGADPRQIGFNFSGARDLHIDNEGNLVLASPAQNVVFHRPVAYQQQAGTRQLVNARFVMTNDRVGFALGSFDSSRELIIDPTVSYSTFLGGSAEDDANAIAADATGAYITGQTASADFPSATGTFHVGTFDIFVAKLAPDGSSLNYSTYIGGNNDDSGNAIVVDTSGNAYIAGGTNSSDFPVTAGVLQTAFKGITDAFLLKLDATGTTLTYSTLLGGSLSDVANGVAIDSSKNAVIVGTTLSSDYPTQTPKQATPGNGFVTKVNATATAYVFSTYLGGTGGDTVTAVAVDSTNNAYVTGSTSDPNFPVTVAAVQPNCGTDSLCNGGLSDAFVTVYDSTGANYVYSTFLGGSGADQGLGIAVDPSKNAYITGFTKSTDYPTLAALMGTFGGGLQDAFVTKLNPSGAALIYSTYLGGNLDDTGTGIALDSSGNAYVTGQTDSSNFVTSSATQGTLAGLDDAFVTQINPAGSLLFSTYLGGSQVENTVNGTAAIGAIAVDNAGNIYVAGNTTSAANFPTLTPFQGTYAGSADAFVVKYAPAGTFSVSVSPSSATVTSGQSTGPFTVTVAPVNGFTGDVTLSCVGLPAASTCNFATNPVTGALGTSQLTISTTTHTNSAVAARSTGTPSLLYGLLVIPGLAFMGVGFRPGRTGKKKVMGVLLLCLMFSGFLFLPACGSGNGGGAHGTPPGSYTVTVKGTSGASVVNATPAITLTVQ
jgi:hypothetical protein